MANDLISRVAPHLIVGLAGTVLGDDERRLLAAAPPAGIILFDRNIESVSQTVRLVDEARRAAGAPLLVCADHEGGVISVLARAVGAPPSPAAAWFPHDEELLAAWAAGTARRAAACGVNLLLAPLADIDTDPDNPVIGTRAFSADPEETAMAVRTAVSAFAAEGMLTCLKHFPGHGATKADSHLTLPVIDADRRTLAARELVPFAAGIAAGADCVMSAHVALRGGDRPASLDPALLRGLLRDEMGFTGVVITDALEMAGILPDRLPMSSIDPRSRKEEGTGPAAVIGAALEAGNDLLLFSRPVAEAFAELEGAVKDGGYGQLLPERLETAAVESLARIAALRVRAGDGPGTVADSATVERKIAGRSIRIVGDTAEALRRLPGGRPPRLVIAGPARDLAYPVVRRFAARLADALGVEAVFADLPMRGQAVGSRPPEAADGAAVIFVSRSVLELSQATALASGASVVVAAGRPAEASLAPPGVPAIATLGVYDAAADELARILRGG